MATFAITTKVWMVSTFIICVTTGLCTFCLSIALWGGKGPFLSFKLPVVIDGICNLLDFIGRVLCVRYLPVSLAMAINASTPIYGCILETCIDPTRYSQRLKMKRGICVVFICISIFIQSYGALSFDDNMEYTFGEVVMGISLSAGSAIARVIANYCVERCKDEEVKLHHWIMADVLGYVSLPIIIPLIMPMGNLEPLEWFKGFSIAIIFLFCCYTALSTFKFNDISVTTALSIRTLEIPTVYLFGTVLLGEARNMYTFLGCASVTFWSIFIVTFLSSEENGDHFEEETELLLQKKTSFKQKNSISGTTILSRSLAVVRSLYERKVYGLDFSRKGHAYESIP